MSECEGLKPVCLPNFIQTTKIVEDIEQYTGLHCAEPGLICFELPEALCLSDEAIEERLGIPVLRTVRKPWIANLRRD